MRWALFISVALNLLLIGAGVGVGLGEWRRQKEQASAVVARTPTMRSILDALPPERATEVQTKVADAWRTAKDERRAAREANLEVARIVGAETYDRAAAGAAFARMRAANSLVAGRFHEVVSEALASMTVEERRALLRALAARGADATRDGAGELRRALRQMPPEERRAVMREFMEERRETLKEPGGGEMRRRLQERREEFRRRRLEETLPPAPEKEKTE